MSDDPRLPPEPPVPLRDRVVYWSLIWLAALCVVGAALVVLYTLNLIHQ